MYSTLCSNPFLPFPFPVSSYLFFLALLLVFMLHPITDVWTILDFFAPLYTPHQLIAYPLFDQEFFILFYLIFLHHTLLVLPIPPPLTFYP